MPHAQARSRTTTRYSAHFKATAVRLSRLPGVLSTYRWQGRVESAEEVLLLIKTTTDRFAALRERVLALHPYELPELIALPVDRGHPAYLEWVRRGG